MKSYYKGMEWLTFFAMVGALLCTALDLYMRRWDWAIFMGLMAAWDAWSLDDQIKRRKANEELKP